MPLTYAKKLQSCASNTIDRYLPVNSVRRRFAAGVTWSSVSMAVSRVASVIAGILVARILGVTSYGEFGTIRMTTAMFGILSGFGLGLTATKYIAALRVSNPPQAGRVWGLVDNVTMLTCVTVGIGIFFLAPFVATTILKQPSLTLVLRIGILVMAGETITGVQRGILAGFEAFREIALVNFLVGFLNLIFMVAGAWIWHLEGAVAGLGIATLIGAVVSELFLKKLQSRSDTRRDRKLAWREFQVLWKFSLPTVITSMMFVVSEWLCITMLVNQPEGYEEMGVFNVAYRWTFVVTFIPLTIMNPALSLLSSLYGTKQYHKFKRLVYNNFKIVAGLAALVSGTLAIAGGFIIDMYGQGFSESTYVLRVLCIMVFLKTLLMIMGQALYSMGRVKTDFCLGLFRTLVLIFAFWLLRDHGAKGLAWAMVIAFSLLFAAKSLITLWLVNKQADSIEFVSEPALKRF